MSRPSRSSSGPPRKQIQELFSFPALWDPKCLLFLYTMVYMSGRHVSTQQVILRPSKKTDPRIVQFSCIVGSQMLTSLCYRNIKYIRLYILNLCDGFSLIISNIRYSILKSLYIKDETASVVQGQRAALQYPSSRVQTRPKPSDFQGEKNPQHAFLRRGSKAVGPMPQICGM